jgi:hypothetical protein
MPGAKNAAAAAAAASNVLFILHPLDETRNDVGFIKALSAARLAGAAKVLLFWAKRFSPLCY